MKGFVTQCHYFSKKKKKNSLPWKELIVCLEGGGVEESRIELAKNMITLC